MCTPLERRGIRRDIINIISASWRKSTKKQYSVYIKKWRRFCEKKKVNHMYSDVNDVLEFLSELYHTEKAGYSVINQARSALSSFLTLSSFSVGNHPLICRFVKGVFNLRPPAPRYKEIWDVGPVFNYLRCMSPANSLSLKRLTLKLCMIIALTSAQRIQCLHRMKLDNMKLKNNSVTFCFGELIKQSRPGHIDYSVTMKAYPPDRRLCVVRYIREYIKRTSSLRGSEKQLLISYRRPHNSVTTQTIARWLKELLKSAGIDTDKYKAHSTRAASTSAAKSSDLPVTAILEQAGWSNERTFRTFYNKPRDNRMSFTEAVIKPALV